MYQVDVARVSVWLWCLTYLRANQFSRDTGVCDNICTALFVPAHVNVCVTRGGGVLGTEFMLFFIHEKNSSFCTFVLSEAVELPVELLLFVPCYI